MPSLAPHRLLVLAIAALCVGVAGCHRRAEGGLRVAIIGSGTPTVGDPVHGPASEGEAVLRSATAQGLVQFDSSGQIEAGLAERWNVSDDGLSYIFRLAETEWHDGSRVNAREVARLLTRIFRSAADDPARDTVGAVEEVVAMTDRVIEIRLRAPRPNLLTLLAQPDFALIRGAAGTGPFALQAPRPVETLSAATPLVLQRLVPGVDGEEGVKESVSVTTLPAAAAIAAYRDQRVDVVLGGTVTDLPIAEAARLPRGELRFDPVAGLFGLMPVKGSAVAGDERMRRVLSEAIDRQALLAALSVPGLTPRATLLQQGLADLAAPVQLAWLAQPPDQRRPALLAELDRARQAPRAAAAPPPPIAVGLPDGPGGDLILARLKADWGALGFAVVRAEKGQRADFRLLDAVAPSDSPAWFVRRFRCAVAAVCLEDLDPLLDSARESPDSHQRAALLAQAAAKIDEAQLFLPLAAPIRWSLVGRSAPGFDENRYARHPLGDLAGTATGGSNP